jgi:GNAT superfamily N-acetyltransferase
MSDPRIRVLSEADEARAYATLTLAFAADPCERWLYPGGQQYLTHFPEFLKAFGGGAFRTGTAWCLDDFGSVSLWLPPGTGADGNAIVELLLATVAPGRHDDMLAVLTQMDEAHPTYPHWYLPWFGTDPAKQGHGRGSALMAHCLDIVDADHVPTYLETPNPRTIPFYRRHGFEIVATAQAGACPPLTGMLRTARSGLAKA